MSYTRILLAILVLGFASPTMAQQPPVDPAVATKIRELLNLTGTMATMQEMATRMLDLMLPQLTAMIEGASHKKPTPEYINLLKVEMKNEFAASVPDLEERLVELYARHFTRDDITALIAFYRTPAGQKFRTELPAITREGGTIGQAWGAATGQRAAANANEKARVQKIQMFEP